MTCSHVFCLTLYQPSLDFSVKMAKDKTVYQKQKWVGRNHTTWWQVRLGIPGGGQAARAWPQMLPDQAALEGTKASMKVSQPETALSSDPAKHCTTCQNPFRKKKIKVLCLHNRHSLAGTKTSSLVHLADDYSFLVYSLWGGDDGFAGRGGQPSGSLLEAWEITSDWLGVSVFAEGAHLKWQRQLNAENVFSRLW